MIFGNPNHQAIDNIKNSIWLRELLTQKVLEPLKEFPPPTKLKTLLELVYLYQLGEELDSERQTYCQRLDTNMYDVMAEYLDSFGISTSTEQITHELSMYEPIIDYLKLVYNRPRPWQVAPYYHIPLYPRVEMYHPGSSYPGGHTMMALFLYHIYGTRHPELKRDLLEFVKDVKLSREQIGVHFPSDGVFSFKVYKHIKPFLTTTAFAGQPVPSSLY